jgi:hypothetical protein
LSNPDLWLNLFLDIEQTKTAVCQPCGGKGTPNIFQLSSCLVALSQGSDELKLVLRTRGTDSHTICIILSYIFDIFFLSVRWTLSPCIMIK